MTLVGWFQLEPVCFYTPGSQGIICAHNTCPAAEGHHSLALVRSEVLVVNNLHFPAEYLPEHLEVMFLFLGHMGKEEVRLPGDEYSLVHLLDSHKDITVTEIFPHGNLQVFVFVVSEASDI